MICLNCGGSGHHDEVDARKLVLVKPKGFPSQPLDPVAVAGPPYVAFRYGQPQPG